MKTYKEQYDEAKKVGGIQSITPEFMEFDKKGVSILGEYLSSSEVQGSIGTGTYRQYVFDTDDGLVKFALGAATDREVYPQLIVNEVYRVEFIGKEKISGGRQVNKFKVERLISEAVEGDDKEGDIPI